MQGTFTAKTEEVVRSWFIVDAAGKPLGRLASEIASVLRGKHRPTYTPHVDAGDFVIVLNAGKVKLTGNKVNQKNYYSYSGHMGGLRTTTARDMLETKPEYVLEHAVKGMLPKNPLGRAMLSKLKLYADDKHTHQAQQPKPLTVRL